MNFTIRNHRITEIIGNKFFFCKFTSDITGILISYDIHGKIHRNFLQCMKTNNEDINIK